MIFTAAFLSAVLAFSDQAAAAVPHQARYASSNSAHSMHASATTSTASPSPTATTPANQLSLVQQLMLAPLAADRFALLPDNKDFVINLEPEPVPAGKGGNLVAANRKTFPALVGAGAGMAVGVIKPCGINTFHVHPRSAELQILIKGSLVVEMTPENGVLDPATGKRRVIRNTLSEFDMTPFYQGSVHHQFNPNCTDAVFVASFASEDFGTGQVVDEVFSMDKNAIIDTFGATLSGDDVERIKAGLPESIVQGVEVCMQKCYNHRV
ncbi:Spherulin-1A [Ceratocystis platani]|uniref:Spherulin-1A n=1 Tax=Ceratocystis fimbriata f. sp. platani TaxID=88771 RepID=A0A0F8AYR7_CERFI|nr:Spherulin-1A [Ceratocystis platani]